MMATTTPVELIYFAGCPNVDTARANIRAALSAKGLSPAWRERNQLDEGVPDRVKQYGSPTVLVDGRDVAETELVSAMACRTDGAPSVEQILSALG